MTPTIPIAMKSVPLAIILARISAIESPAGITCVFVWLTNTPASIMTILITTVLRRKSNPKAFPVGDNKLCHVPTLDSEMSLGGVP